MGAFAFHKALCQRLIKFKELQVELFSKPVEPLIDAQVFGFSSLPSTDGDAPARRRSEGKDLKFACLVSGLARDEHPVVPTELDRITDYVLRCTTHQSTEILLPLQGHGMAWIWTMQITLLEDDGAQQ